MHHGENEVHVSGCAVHGAASSEVGRRCGWHRGEQRAKAPRRNGTIGGVVLLRLPAYDGGDGRLAISSSGPSRSKWFCRCAGRGWGTESGRQSGMPSAGDLPRWRRGTCRRVRSSCAGGSGGGVAELDERDLRAVVAFRLGGMLFFTADSPSRLRLAQRAPKSEKPSQFFMAFHAA